MIQKLQNLSSVYQVDRKKINSVCSFMVIALCAQNGHAQLVNKGKLKVENNTVLSVYMDCDNEATGEFINDGKVHAFGNYNNDGTVTYSDKSKGETYFEGVQEQTITGSETADFQNVIFDNLASEMPVHLKTIIAVGNNADFKNGIVNAVDPAKEGKMIFKENAKHSSTGDQSFVDGKVEKIGKEAFEYPVGNQLVYRPSLHAAGAAAENVYTTQYFNQNSDGVNYPHSSKDEDILAINDKEYWKVTQDGGSEKIVLSLSLKNGVTPSEFFDNGSGTKIAIVRWDAAQAKWVNDHGELSDPDKTDNYSKLLTAQVGGYGIFTMAIVKNTDIIDKLTVYNAVSPNGDGINDTFHIKDIALYPDNTVEIYNRWGVKVFETNGYNESDNVFAGYSDGRATVKRGDKLPTGTYFYILKYNNTKKVVEQSGYLYINNQ